MSRIPAVVIRCDACGSEVVFRGRKMAAAEYRMHLAVLGWTRYGRTLDFCRECGGGASDTPPT